MSRVFSVVMLLAGLWLTPDQPTSTLRVIAIYSGFRGFDNGIGAGWPIEVTQNGHIVATASTDDNSEHTFTLPDGRYFIQIFFNGRSPFVSYRCQQFYTLTKDSHIIIRCWGTSWLPFLSD